MNCKIFFSFSFFFISFCYANAFNITSILGQYPDFSSFSNYLTQTQLASQINSRQTITVLVVDNGALSPVSGKPMDVLANILGVHVVLDYYDVQKLENLPNKTAILTTLFQASGRAAGQQGFLNVTNVATGNVMFGSAVSGSTLSAKLVKSIAAQPYNISILQISAAIIPTGIENSNSNSNSTNSPTPTPVPAASPNPTNSAPPSPVPVAAPNSTNAAPPTPVPAASPGKPITPPAASPTTPPLTPTKAPAPATTVPPATSPPPETSKAPAPSMTNPPSASPLPNPGVVPPPSTGSPEAQPPAADTTLAPAADTTVAPAADTAVAPAADTAVAPAAADMPGSPPMPAGPIAYAPEADAPAPAGDAPSAGTSFRPNLGVVFITVFSASSLLI